MFVSLENEIMKFFGHFVVRFNYVFRMPKVVSSGVGFRWIVWEVGGSQIMFLIIMSVVRYLMSIR